MALLFRERGSPDGVIMEAEGLRDGIIRDKPRGGGGSKAGTEDNSRDGND